MKYTDKHKPPKVDPPDFDEIADELKALPQWILWKYLWQDGKDGKSGSWQKIPLKTDGYGASSTDPATWSDFESVRLAFNDRQGHFSGIGFVFTRESGIVGIDLDNCLTWEEGRFSPILDDWVKHTLVAVGDTYMEYSPSMTGVHFYVKANPSQALKRPEIEIYAEGRFFTVTGKTWGVSTIADATEAVDRIIEAESKQEPARELSPGEIAQALPKNLLRIEDRLQIAFHGSNGAAIKKLFDGEWQQDYPSESEADLALANYLAFYSDGNPSLLALMMECSKLVRPKWAKSYGNNTTYLSRTIDTALKGRTEYFKANQSLINFTGKPSEESNARSNRVYRLLDIGQAALKDRSDPAAKGLVVDDESFCELDYVYRPRKKLLTVIVGDPAAGKALALDTKIPTPTGWTTMGEIKVGDKLFDETGYICSVTFATDVQYDRKCYRVTFSDGSEIIADAEHLWTTRTEAARQRQIKLRLKGQYESIRLQTFTTEQIKKSLFTKDKTKRKNHAVALTMPVQLPEQEYLVDPYVLGSWLGDGASAGGRIYSNDPEIIEEIEKAGFKAEKRSAPFLYQIRKLQVLLRMLGVLSNKHIPLNYLRGSYSQRLSLLQGLMDTDGYVDRSGRCEFTSTNRRLAEGVKDLLNGLGISANICTGRATIKGKDCGIKYRISFTTVLPVFRLSRKLIRLPKVQKFDRWRLIDTIEEIDSVPVKCIQVNSPSKLYLVGENYIPTHNTTFAINYLYHLGKAHNLRIGLTAFENSPVDLTHSLVSAHLRKPVFPEFEGCCSDEEYLQALDQIGNQFTIYEPTWEEANCQALSQYWEDSIARTGLDAILLDPFSNLQPTEQLLGKYTDFANQQLGFLWRYVQTRSLMGFLLCHPTKEYDRSAGPPKLRNINGTGGFDRCADFGIGLTRISGKLVAEINKVRHWRTGEMGAMVAWNYDQKKSFYLPTTVPPLKKSGSGFSGSFRRKSTAPQKVSF